MADDRARILSDVRRALRRKEPLSDEARARLSVSSDPRANPQGDLEQRITRFTEQLEAASGRVSRVESIEEVSTVVEQYLIAIGQPLDIVAAPEPRLNAVPWSNRFRIERRAARGEDRVGINVAFAGIAETGSVVVTTSAVSPGNLSFLPEDHLCVLFAGDIVDRIEDVWAKLSDGGDRPMPRAVSIISAPSKTADVEFTLQEGAHGPRRIHAIIVGQ